jgi:4,5-DOPA dioxygenase extradiol
MSTTRAPAIFFGHGNPMNALGGPFADEWRRLGETFPKPRAILMVSAHWFVDHTAVTAMAQPKTIHDFYGFPQALHDVIYPAPGDSWLVERVSDVLKDVVPVGHDQVWGLDHGTWSVLVHTYPDADVPVVQLSIDATKPPEFHYELGRKLAALRDEGVLIAASGDVVHNLRAARLAGGIAPYDWAVRFNATVKDAIGRGDHQALMAGADLDGDAALSIPTDEHWLPLLYVLGAADAAEQPHFFTDVIDAGSVSMLGVGYGLDQKV